MLHLTTKDNDKLSLEWTNTANLKRWMARQRTRSGWLLHTEDEVFFSEYQEWIQRYWSYFENLNGFQLSNNAKILDIGSGIGIVDLFLALKLDKSEVTLLDKNLDYPINGNQFGELHPFYNSWEPTLDIIKTTNLDLSRFNFIYPEDVWPQEVDFVSSHFSWCWHYNVNTYLEKAYGSLKKDGLLLLTVRFTNSEDVVEILNKKFGKNLDFLYFDKDKQIRTEKNIFDVPGPYYGGMGLWKKT